METLLMKLRGWMAGGRACCLDVTPKKKPTSADAGFLIPGRLGVLRLVADPRRPRTIIRAQRVAVGVIKLGEADDHAGDANRSFSLAQLFQRQRRRRNGRSTDQQAFDKRAVQRR
ncbi:hypothetical protein ACFFJ4_01005 [Xanthomonas dyei]|uniref:hypothetical protein n=1 Tax=Xanthomonas dyei TaxID=743699 RepID=UPI00130482ED|nr:hypothetical protein [Xanthomonas dyei]